MAQRYDILDGPSKLELMFSLFDRKRFLDPVLFRVLKGGLNNCVHVMIAGIEKEDDSCERWLFKGRITFDTSNNRNAVTGFYETRNRRGQIEIQD